MRKIILQNSMSPGDIVMLTAAVRDLHKGHPGAFATELRTSAKGLWENNPYVTKFAEGETDIETVTCAYPLIHRSNKGPWHFIHGFTQHLGEQLGVRIEPTEFKGDIHLSADERRWRRSRRYRCPFGLWRRVGKNRGCKNLENPPPRLSRLWRRFHLSPDRF